MRWKSLDLGLVESVASETVISVEVQSLRRGTECRLFSVGACQRKEGE